ncbi:rare lipoprotein A [Luminiphilus syltensis NOR5-1B]|uniref:Endolytic peptidoglycan transglycosylase RlpA n=2 Tax=Luminiphilus TaxID=1341118 RepID=B8KSL8_9GAMM|nr:rare lipoprotein A [Luminiphilus syltensis NOR5-1B]
MLMAACGGAPPGDDGVSDGTPPPIDPAMVADAVVRPDPIRLSGNISPYTVNGRTYTVLDSAAGYRKKGTASWYGTKFHGRRTSNGEIFDVYAATAAHKTLPIPSYARVTNLDNNRSMVVRVNDRGPFHDNRIIDLSYGAAVKLGFANQGTAPVIVEALSVVGAEDRRFSEDGDYRNLQIGAYSNKASAEKLASGIATVIETPVQLSPVDGPHGRLYRLRAGPFSDAAALAQAQAALRAAGFPEGQPLP